MKKIYLFTVLILVTVIQVSMSQTVTVLDKETLKPVKGASVSVNDKDFIYTNVLGQADVSQFKGNESVKFQASGYQTMVYTFSRLESDKFTVSLGSKSYSTDEIVVSADRFNELLKDVPRQIDVLNTKDIQYENVQNTAQLLEKTGNVSVQTSQQGGGSVVLRGFEASRVLIVIDGVRLNNAIFRAGHLQNILRIDNNMLDKVEVLYGPGSLMYGSDALGGVMNF